MLPDYNPPLLPSNSVNHEIRLTVDNSRSIFWQNFEKSWVLMPTEEELITQNLETPIKQF